jgi:RNA polymerase sigma-70 factor (ECF subfamily)
MRDLIDRAMTGDRDAFNALAARVGDELFAIARRILRDRHRAEDAVQSGLLAAWQNLPKLREPDRFEAWMYRLLVNECYRQARREQHERSTLDLVMPGPDHTDHASELADRDAVERSFMKLSPQHRAVVVLHHYRGLPLVEVASVLNIPAGTAYSRLHYAHERMREVLTAEMEPVTSRGIA